MAPEWINIRALTWIAIRALLTGGLHGLRRGRLAIGERRVPGDIRPATSAAVLCPSLPAGHLLHHPAVPGAAPRPARLVPLHKRPGARLAPRRLLPTGTRTGYIRRARSGSTGERDSTHSTPTSDHGTPRQVGCCGTGTSPLLPGRAARSATWRPTRLAASPWRGAREASSPRSGSLTTWERPRFSTTTGR